MIRKTYLLVSIFAAASLLLVVGILFAGSIHDDAIRSGIDQVTPSFSGVVRLQGRSAHNGVEIVAWTDNTPVFSSTTGVSGVFTLTLPSGTYTITAESDRYLDGEQTALSVTPDTSIFLPELQLLGGEPSHSSS